MKSHNGVSPLKRRAVKSGVTLLFFFTVSSHTDSAAQNFWKQTSPITSTGISCLAVNSSGHIFAGAHDGYFLSTDQGNSWKLVSPFDASGLPRDITSLVFSSSGDIFAGNHEGIFRSQDDGGSWKKVSTNDNRISQISALLINTSGDVFAVTGSNGIYISRDNGESWSWLVGGFTTSLAINSSGHIFVGMRRDGILRSTDNGTSWTAVNTSLMNKDVLALAINSKDYIFAGTNGGGVFRSRDNGGSWAPVNNGLSGTWSVSRFGLNAIGDVFVSAGIYNTNTWGVFRSSDDGGSWVKSDAGLYTINRNSINAVNINFAIDSDGHFLAAFLGVYRSTDNGTSWTPITSGLMDATISKLAINSSGHTFAVSGSLLSHTMDNGESWEFVTLISGRIVNTCHCH